MIVDPIEKLTHDHGDLNQRVLALSAQIRGLERAGGDVTVLTKPLVELRENLFLHFAREEEGLFPFVAQHVNALAEQIQIMEVAHDTICGALVRMIHLTSTSSPLPTVEHVFERFENAYAAHAVAESELLGELAARLDADQRAALAALVEGL